jgi:DNA-binding transcriptional MerR regulator
VLDSGVDSRLYADDEAVIDAIGRVAQSTGLSVDTIRFYEKQSLIPLAQRTDGGYSVYDESTVDRLQLIGRAQSRGFSLQEISELLLIEDGEPNGCSHVRHLIADKVRQVKEKIAGLRRIRFAHDRAGVVRATIRAEAVASVTERPLCDPLSHDTPGKSEIIRWSGIFLVRDDEPQSNVCVASFGRCDSLDSSERTAQSLH